MTKKNDDAKRDADDDLERAEAEETESAEAERAGPDGDDSEGHDDPRASAKGERDDDRAEASASDEDEHEDEDEDGDADPDGDDDADEDADADDEEDADDDDGDEDARGARRAARPAAQPASEEKSQMPMLAAAAVLIGVAIAAAFWWSDQQPPAEDAELASDEAERSLEDMAADPMNPFGAAPGAGEPPPQPSPIPAPDDVAAPPENAERSESGLAWRVLQEGTGTEHPGEDDLVTLNYTGWTTEGQMVESTAMRGEPATLPLNRAIAGWGEAVQLMVAGERRRLWVPAELADTGRGAPPGMIVFDMELVEFRSPPPTPDAPETVSGPPPNAETTESGLAHEVLQAGTGDTNPTGQDRVRIHFTGWTTDGEMFDSSTTMGEPATLPPLERVVPGMREGIEMMVVGEKRRLWVPEELAFAGRAGAPEGMLVFDIELLEIIAPPPGMPGMPPGMPGMPPGMPGQGGPQGMPGQGGPRPMPHPGGGGPPPMPHPGGGGPPPMPHPGGGGPPPMPHPGGGGPQPMPHPGGGGPQPMPHPGGSPPR